MLGYIIVRSKTHLKA